jgi:alpha-galactosidase
MLVLLLALVFPALGLNNGLARTPAMGYNTWNDYQCNVTEDDVKNCANALVNSGLAKLGYNYVNLDDCWAWGRYPNGTIYADPTTFPSGIASLASYVHSLGLKFGIYTDRGFYTCQKRPGSKNYEQIDAETYASWGVDYLKEDSCYSLSHDREESLQDYSVMRDALNSTGRPIYFSLCGWHEWYAPPGQSLGNSWRIANDDTDWSTVLTSINANANLSEYAGPGGWNDPDMLIGTGYFNLTNAQSRTQFSMWAVMAAPLLIGSNLLNMSSYEFETITNTEVIAVDQDPMGIQGIRLVGADLFAAIPGSNIWGRPLQNGAWAVCFLNNHPMNATLTCDQACFAKMGFTSGTLSVRDLWAHEQVGFITPPFTYGTRVPGQGASAMLTFTLVSTDI